MNKLANYYPTRHLGCNPIHPVMDWAKVRRIVRAARRGEVIPPILIDGRRGNCNLLAGTHRAAANDLMILLGGDPLIGYVSADDIELDDCLQQAIEDGDYGRIDEIWDQDGQSLSY